MNSNNFEVNKKNDKYEESVNSEIHVEEFE